MWAWSAKFFQWNAVFLLSLVLCCPHYNCSVHADSLCIPGVLDVCLGFKKRRIYLGNTLLSFSCFPESLECRFLFRGCFASRYWLGVWSSLFWNIRNTEIFITIVVGGSLEILKVILLSCSGLWWAKPLSHTA